MSYCNENLELTKQDTQMAKGIAILAMIALHLFCRNTNLPYTPLIYLGDTPLVYFLGLFGDMCVSIYCFCSGYAHYLLCEKEGAHYTARVPKRLLSFLSNFWIVLILFSVIGFFFDKTGTIPGGIWEFLGNAFLFDLSYNGAWWFVLTYVFLVLLSPLLFMLTRKLPAILLVPASGVLYFCAHVFRFVIVPEFSSPIASWFFTQLVLLGTSQFGYIIGMTFRKYRWITTLRTFCKVHSKIMKLAICVIPIALFLLHCIEQSAIIAPITGIGTIVCFWLWKKPQCVERITLFFGKHSTNIWLTHMFFYAVLFKDFVFIAKFPILIFLLLIGVCLIFSVPINGLLSYLRKPRP